MSIKSEVMTLAFSESDWLTSDQVASRLQRKPTSVRSALSQLADHGKLERQIGHKPFPNGGRVKRHIFARYRAPEGYPGHA